MSYDARPDLQQSLTRHYFSLLNRKWRLLHARRLRRVYRLQFLLCRIRAAGKDENYKIYSLNFFLVRGLPPDGCIIKTYLPHF